MSRALEAGLVAIVAAIALIWIDFAPRDVTDFLAFVMQAARTRVRKLRR